MSLVQNLKVEYKKENFVLDVSHLEIPDQGITLIQGHSGSGKTTFLKCLMGLEEAKFDWIFKGQNLAHMPSPDRRLGVVFQSIDLFPNLTVEENILFHAQARKLKPSEYKEKLQKWLSITKLSQKLRQKTKTLSGGEKQRVAILRALIGQPRLLLLDEPFSALDPHLKKDLQKLVTDIVKSESLPCLVVTHDENDAANFANHVIIFENGKTRSIA
jgi:sulfate transport system ATP-binding protein/putative spermidine/putrescine transport system ATP-binding protein